MGRKPVEWCLTSLLAASALLAQPLLATSATAETALATSACLQISAALNKRADQLHRSNGWQIPREFTRVAANTDDYCRDRELDKAIISIDWMNTCLDNFEKPFNLGFCVRSKKYFCAVEPDSDGCRSQ